MTTLHIVRHGPTHARGLVGWSDLPADLGDTAALGRLSAFLPADATVISSDLRRARDTADAIQGGRRRLPDDPGLREMHFGAWELRRLAEIAAEDPGRARAFRARPHAVRPPGGESWDEARGRIGVAIDALIAAYPGGDLVVVAHLGVILSQLQRAGAIAEAEVLARRIDPLSVTRLAVTPRGWVAEMVNHRP